MQIHKSLTVSVLLTPAYTDCWDPWFAMQLLKLHRHWTLQFQLLTMMKVAKTAQWLNPKEKSFSLNPNMSILLPLQTRLMSSIKENSALPMLKEMFGAQY
jgi:hypothetical protein